MDAKRKLLVERLSLFSSVHPQTMPLSQEPSHDVLHRYIVRLNEGAAEEEPGRERLSVRKTSTDSAKPRASVALDDWSQSRENQS